MLPIPSFRISQDQRQKYSCTAAVVSEYCLNQINDVLTGLSVDEKLNVPQFESQADQTTTKTRPSHTETTRKQSAKKRSKATPTSETTEPQSLIDIDIPLEASSEVVSSVTSNVSSCTSSSASKRSSFRWGRKSPSSMTRVPAQVGEMIASRCQLGDASIEGDFASIQYGTHNGRPACHIMVDFRLVFQPTSTINWAQIQFRFGSDAGTTGSQISKAFSPDELTGQYDTTQEIRAISPNIGLGMAGCKANISGISQQQARIKRRQWRVQGTREEHSGSYDTFCWKVIENEFSEDSVPRHFRTGMVVYLPSTSEPTAEHKADFWVDVSVEGTLRSRRSKHKKVQERRWFEPSLAQRESCHMLDGNVLINLVKEGNKNIPDLGQAERTLEPVPAFPALPASAAASVDVPAKTSATKAQGETDNIRHSAVTSYEISEMEDLVQMHAAHEAVALPC
jgi:hypothetical protein